MRRFQLCESNMDSNDITLVRKWAKDCADALGVAKAERDFALYGQNLRGVVRHNLMIGLILWRRGQSPRRPLEAALDAFIEHRPALKAINPNMFGASTVPEKTAMIVGFLLGRRIEPWFAYAHHNVPDARLDCLLAMGLEDCFPQEVARNELSAVRANATLALLADTYQTYFEILEASNHEHASTTIELAELHYRARAQDEFYVGGEHTDGGGATNSLIVDYRLAAVLKRIGYAGKSVHRWRW
jgi:hypothetical protein